MRAVDEADVEFPQLLGTGGGRGGGSGLVSHTESLSKPSTPDDPDSVDGAAQLVAPLSPHLNMRKISLLKRPSPGSVNFRSLVVENQLQNVVVEVSCSVFFS